MKPMTSQGHWQRWHTQALRWAPAIIVVITALVYYNAIFSEFSVFDDSTFILRNPLVLDSSPKGIMNMLTTFSGGKYQPLTNLSFAIEYRMWGFNPVAFHLTNIIIHLLCTLLTYAIVNRLSKNTTTAIIAALLFGLHPMHVEDVAWASELKDVLYAFFYLLALLAYLSYMQSGYKIRYYVLTFLLFLLSLCSKTEAITLPLVVFIVDVYSGRKITLKQVLEKLPMLVVSVMFLALGFLSRQADSNIAGHGIPDYGFINHLFLWTSVPAFYLVKLIAPFGLSAMYLYPDLHNGLLPWPYYASLPFVLLVAVFIVWRRPFRREIIFGMSFFVATICIMPQIITVGPSLTPERYSYIPYIGLFYIIGRWAAKESSTKWRVPVLTIMTGMIILFSFQTWRRILVWKNSDTLFTDIIAKNAGITEAAYYYGLRANYEFTAKNFKAAIEDYDQLISAFPDNVDAHADRSTAHYLLGNFAAAVADLDEAIRLNPGHSKYYFNRASMKARSQDWQGALSDYNACIDLDSSNSKAYEDRGVIRIHLKDSTGACVDWSNAASLGNDNAKKLMQQFCSNR